MISVGRDLHRVLHCVHPCTVHRAPCTVQGCCVTMCRSITTVGRHVATNAYQWKDKNQRHHLRSGITQNGQVFDDIGRSGFAPCALCVHPCAPCAVRCVPCAQRRAVLQLCVRTVLYCVCNACVVCSLRGAAVRACEMACASRCSSACVRWVSSGLRAGSAAGTAAGADSARFCIFWAVYMWPLRCKLWGFPILKRGEAKTARHNCTGGTIDASASRAHHGDLASQYRRSLPSNPVWDAAREFVASAAACVLCSPVFGLKVEMLWRCPACACDAAPQQTRLPEPPTSPKHKKHTRGVLV